MSDITDEAATEGHHLIHNAEIEEQKASLDILRSPPYYSSLFTNSWVNNVAP
jgi:hypothetical protein